MGTNTKLAKWGARVALASLAALIASAFVPGAAFAQEAAAAAEPPPDVGAGLDLLWTVLAAILVFFMQAGFALVEAGFTRAKNLVNIFMKNLMDFSIGSVTFFLIGFGLMFGVSESGWFGTSNFAGDLLKFDGDANAFESEVGAFNYAFLLFQTVFAATAATIVSGAMAERTKFKSYLFYTVVITVVIYPVFGSWGWGSLWNGSGWLEGMGFADFAGSTVVHSVGGWAALAGAIVLGPRLGKYGKDGKVRPIRGHNMALAGLGTFILWLGWFGFNAGSTTAVMGAELDLAKIAVNTNLAAAAGAIFAMIVAWVTVGKPDIGMSLNGALAGLVGITAPCNDVTPVAALAIGAVAGGIVVASIQFFEKVKVDDPVGAISVHGVCGAWGTLACALFGTASIGTQLIGIGAAFAWTFGTAFILFKGIDVVFGLRVSEEEELEGLDIVEHGNEAYPVDSVAGYSAVEDGPAKAGSPALETASQAG